MMKCLNKLEERKKFFIAIVLLLLIFSFPVFVLPLLPTTKYVNVEISLYKYEELDSPGFFKLDNWIPVAVGISSGKADIRIPSNFSFRFRFLYYLKFHSLEGLRINDQNVNRGAVLAPSHLG